MVEHVPLFRTSIGKKLLMASAGVVLFGYVVLHLVGNLKIFFGPDPFNHYAEWLRVAGAPLFPDESVLWIARVILLAALIVHVGAWLQLWRRSRAARRTGYREFHPEVFSQASRTMVWGGIAIFAFVGYHLLHMTTGDVHPEFIVGDPYRNVIAGFNSWWVTGIYTVGVVALGFHLYHGLWSATQTFGWNSPSYQRWRRPAALITSVAIVIGYLIIPFSVMAGVLR